MDKLGLIIPTKDRPQTLRRCLHTLAATEVSSKGYPVYVLCDTTGTIEENRKLCKQYNVQCIEHQFTGIHDIWNHGVKLAIADSCDYITICDDDIMFQEPPDHLKFALNDEAYSDTGKMVTDFNIKQWPTYVINTLKRSKTARAIQFSKPHRTSALAFEASLYNELEMFDPKYTDGNWHDDDITLTLANLSTSTPKNAIRDNIILTRNWVFHFRTGEGSSWSGSNNRKYFESKWTSVSKDHPLARECKCHEKYYALTTELEEHEASCK